MDEDDDMWPDALEADSLQERFENMTTRAAHCHTCFQLIPQDPYTPVCPSCGDLMYPCVITRYQLSIAMRQWN